MNSKEALNLVGVALANYPNMQEKDMRPTAALWARMLADIPYQVGEKALLYVLSTARFFPTIADILAAVTKVTSPEQLTPAEAWGEVELAIRRHGLYGEAQAIDEMAPEAGRVAKMMGWQDICQSENLGVVRGQFLRMFDAQKKRDEEHAALPAAVKDAMDKLIEGRRME